jgi:hypothetical protein
MGFHKNQKPRRRRGLLSSLAPSGPGQFGQILAVLPCILAHKAPEINGAPAIWNCPRGQLMTKSNY